MISGSPALLEEGVGKTSPLSSRNGGNGKINSFYNKYSMDEHNIM
jgi:hypothetical protein